MMTTERRKWVITQAGETALFEPQRERWEIGNKSSNYNDLTRKDGARWV